MKGIAGLRGPATVAQTLYAETEASEARRRQDAENRRLNVEPASQLQGRPTKRDRRQIDGVRGEAHGDPGCTDSPGWVSERRE